MSKHRIITLYKLCAVQAQDVQENAKTPCIMCVQYRGGCSVPSGDIMINVGDILSTVGGVQYRGGISWVPWGGILSTVGGILSTVGDVQYRGGIL